MSFSSFIGNEPVVQSLKESVRSKNLFHAYLIQGESGSGKGNLAEIFASAILCEKGDGDACGTCISCVKMLHGNHEDFVLYQKDKLSVKDEIIGLLQERIQKKPYHGDKTVVVVQDAETLTPRAQARLLKTLEEPKSGIVLLLLAENINSLASTILSRCIIHQLRPVGKVQLFQYLKAKHQLSDQRAQLVSAVSDGLIGKAEEILASTAFDEQRMVANEFANLILNKKPFYQLAGQIKELGTAKDQLAALLEHMEHWYRDILLMTCDQTPSGLINIDQMTELYAGASTHSSDELMKLIRLVEIAKRDLERNAQPGFILKNLVIKRLQMASS